ncbi:MAG: hypothetical protein PHG64_14170 [Paludibacter sp.]|nr:hypothetical protein [Paludibacter sp.]
MPIVNGEEVLEVTANQLDEVFFNINFGAVTYRALQPTPSELFSSQSVAASSSVTNVTGIHTGNNAKMQVSFEQTGASTDCTMNIYGSDSEDLSIPGIIATANLGSNSSHRTFIEPAAIPEWTFAEIINNHTLLPAIGTIRIMTWQEPVE